MAAGGALIKNSLETRERHVGAAALFSEVTLSSVQGRCGGCNIPRGQSATDRDSLWKQMLVTIPRHAEIKQNHRTTKSCGIGKTLELRSPGTRESQASGDLVNH